MYKVFNKYILRTPLLPISYYRDLTAGLHISDQKLLNEFENPVIREGIFLASPVLYKEILKWSENKIYEQAEIQKIKISFLKYLARLSSRATPFGLFSGITLGRFASEITVEVDRSSHGRNTRLDMNLTGKLVKVLEEISEIKNQLLYYPNTSLYKCGTKLRYVERKYENDLLIYQVVEVDDSDYISKVLNCGDLGFNIFELSRTIIDDDIAEEDAVNFINDLIDNQILISDLEQTVSGDENIDRILFVLKKIKGIDNLIINLELIKEKLNNLDLKLGNNLDDYNDIKNLLLSFLTNFDEKFIFQTDLITKTKTNFLNDEIKGKLLDGLHLLNQITPNQQNILLRDFKKAFIERYESREMPLLTVLDNEIGIGYPINMYNDENPLTDGILFTNNESKKDKNINLTFIQKYLLKKVLESKNEKQYIIEIDENDLNELSIDWGDLPDSFSSIVQIVKVEGNLQISMSVVAGSSAANLLGRFCHFDSEINSFVSEICEFEQNIHKNKIIAEIVHLPEDRIGNVLMRPSFRAFEIPYLSKSSKSDENLIKLDDILISISDDKIILKSKKLGKQIEPRLTTAHNFVLSSLPIYRFLCDMQNSDKRSYVGIDLGILESEFSFLPRIVYKDIILSKAKWRIDLKDFKDIVKNSNDIVTHIKKWAKGKGIPQFVYYIEGDNKLLVNLYNVDSIKMFFSAINNKINITIEESLFDDDGLCKNENNDVYVNEFIVSFYNDIVEN